MAANPGFCACCGSTDGIEKHHLYLRSDGCPDDLTVFLCSECHGRTHGMRRRVNISEATRKGLARAKARGVKIGNPDGGAALAAWARKNGNAHSREGAKRVADANAEALRPFIVQALADDQWSYNSVAIWLTENAVPTIRGGPESEWAAASVRRVMLRLGMKLT